jgi:peptidoglycan/LPS O-acetylase OafA/YrhL
MPEEDAPDRIGIALGALAAGATAGAAVTVLGLVMLRANLAESRDSLPLVLFAGIVSAAALGWSLGRAITDQWRRGVTAALAVFGALMLAGVAAPADMIAGRPGLMVYTAGLAVLAVLAVRDNRRRTGS